MRRGCALSSASSFSFSDEASRLREGSGAGLALGWRVWLAWLLAAGVAGGGVSARDDCEVSAALLLVQALSGSGAGSWVFFAGAVFVALPLGLVRALVRACCLRASLRARLIFSQSLTASRLASAAGI